MTKKLAYLSKRYDAPAGTIDRLLYLRERGFKPILCRGKEAITAGFGLTKPLSDEEIQTRVDKVASRGRFNIGILTGKRGGVFVIDEDATGDFAKLCEAVGIEEPNCPVVKTPSGGNHYYFRYTDDIADVVQKVKFFRDLDIRTNGGYISAPKNTYPGCQDESRGDNCSCSKCANMNREYEPLFEDDEFWVDKLPELPKEIKAKLPRAQKPKKSLVVKEIVNPEDHGFYENIFLELLDVKRSSETQYWSKAVPMMMNLGLGSELIHRFSQRTEAGNYDESAVDRYIAGFDPEKNPPGLGTLRLWLEEDIGKQKAKEVFGQKEMVSRKQFELLAFEDDDWADRFLELNRNNFILTYDGLVWKWEPEKKLWVHLYKDEFTLPICDWGKKYLKDEFEGMLDNYPGFKLMKKRFTTSKGLSAINRLVTARFYQTTEPKGLNIGFCFPLSGGKVLDFERFEIRERVYSDYLNFESPCKIELIPAETEIKAGKKYLLELCNGNSDLCRYFEEIIGCCLVGSNVAKIIPLLLGKADCGKSTFINLLEFIGGKSVGSAPRCVVMESKKEKAGDPELISLVNKRVVFANELKDEDIPSPSKLKMLIGGDKLVGRFNWSNEMVIFESVATPVLISNVIPDFSTEPSFMTKLQVIPFEREFEKEEEFKTKLFSGSIPTEVLLLAMFGYRRAKARKFRFDVPNVSSLKKDDIIEVQESPVETFVKRYHNALDSSWSPISAIYQRYTQENDGSFVHKVTFSKQLIRLGCTRKDGAGKVRGFLGFNIRPN